LGDESSNNRCNKLLVEVEVEGGVEEVGDKKIRIKSEILFVTAEDDAVSGTGGRDCCERGGEEIGTFAVATGCCCGSGTAVDGCRCCRVCCLEVVEGLT